MPMMCVHYSTANELACVFMIKKMEEKVNGMEWIRKK